MKCLLKEILFGMTISRRGYRQSNIVLDEKKYVSMREIKDGLSFIRPEVKKFGVYFMQGLRELSEEDYNFILRKVEENDY